MKQTFTVALREYVFNVKRKEFIIATVGIPLLFLGFAAVGMIPALIMASSVSRQQNIGYVDLSGTLPHTLKEIDAFDEKGVGGRSGPTPVKRQYRFMPFATKEKGLEAYAAKKIQALYVLKHDYLKTGKVEAYGGKGVAQGGSRPALNKLIVQSLLKNRADESTTRRIIDPTDVQRFVQGKSGKWQPEGITGELKRFFLPYIFGMLMMVMIFISSSYLLHGIVEEKENRVIEIILSSVTPSELLNGKLIGLCAVGVTQMAVWVGVGLMPMAMGAGPVAIFMQSLEIPAFAFIACFIYFVLGFLLFAALMAGLGVLGNSWKESQQWASVASFIAVIPIMFIPLIGEAPNGLASRILSYIPFTAPITMMMRISLGEYKAIDLVASILLLALAIWLVQRLAAKLFRLGLLLYGKRPSVMEVVRWLRQT
ncbi:MAG: ABC transporter permease [Armatimonadetes bacterium]|nr:ABC transporter permease [Armatimonadota bacterium]